MSEVLPVKNNPKTIFSWCMYDWANSAYVTTVAVALLPVYFSSVVVGSDGVTIGGTNYSATALWGFIVGAAAFISFLLAPVLGAVADFTNAKKRFLLFFAYTGSLFTLLLYFSKAGDVWSTMIFFFIAQVCFIAANVFYDAFLPQIATDNKMDMVSGKGFSYGYVGGGLQLALAFGLVAVHDKFGISQTQAVRIGILGAGLWWAGFTLFTAKNLREPYHKSTLTESYRKSRFTPAAYAAVGVSRLIQTAKRVRMFRHLVLFLFSYMLYNDGIQTVINMATIYGKDELRLSTTVLLITLLIIQGVASLGAILFSRLAELTGTKKAVMVTLLLWSSIVVYAYFITTTTQFFAIGIMVGIVLGGSQALSRSFYGSMIPEEASAEFYGFYTVFSKFSAIWGPFVFAIIRQTTGTARNSILSIIIFFIVGLVLLYFVDEGKAREAKLSAVFNNKEGDLNRIPSV
ncbi:MAG TPA: MFS transporter [Thermodesulfobacteriota bacterium]|nr:MFS transporter [Thermodesulfobacteriota bacterium]